MKKKDSIKIDESYLKSNNALSRNKSNMNKVWNFI